MALSSSPSLSVTIGKETFSLLEIPKVGTELVEAEKAGLLGELDLKSLVDDLGKLGSFIRVAYNGVAGNTDLQIKVQRVGYKITKLTDESAVTVHKFKQTSRSVLQELQGTYQFLLDGLEEMALETLASLANLAEAEKLQTKFEEATTDVIDALEDTQKAKGAREDHKKELQKQQDEFEVQKLKVQKLQKEAIEARERAEELYAQAQKREDEALEKQDSLLHFVKDAFGKVFSASGKVASTILNPEEKQNLPDVLRTIGEDSAYREAMRMANAEKMKHLEELQKQRDLRREAIQKCIEFTEKIKQCKTDEGLEEVAIDALHNSIGALKSLSAIMMSAALFWRQMQAHCESLANEDMQKIQRAMEYPEEKRIKVWTSTAFKAKGVVYYSKWVALDDVCGTYMEQIKQTRKDLYDQIRENPTIEESRKNVRQLAVLFGENLKEAQEEIAKKKKKGKRGDQVTRGQKMNNDGMLTA